jgi:hypothetical protein
VVGSIEPGKRGDLIVLDGTSEDPYDQLIRAKETDLTLVVINGVPRFGRNTFISSLGAIGEPLTINGQKRTPFLKQDTQDPVVGAIKLSQATATLKEALSKLPAWFWPFSWRRQFTCCMRSRRNPRRASKRRYPIWC